MACCCNLVSRLPRTKQPQADSKICSMYQMMNCNLHTHREQDNKSKQRVTMHKLALAEQLHTKKSLCPASKRRGISSPKLSENLAFENGPPGRTLMNSYIVNFFLPIWRRSSLFNTSFSADYCGLVGLCHHLWLPGISFLPLFQSYFRERERRAENHGNWEVEKQYP